MKSHGFTLIELMIVVSILCIMAAVAIPSYISYLDSASHAEANIIMPDILAKEKAYKQNWGVYVSAKNGYDVELTSGTRSPQFGNGTTAHGDSWAQLGYPVNNSKDGGIFGGPTYFKYAVDNTGNVCARRLKPGISSDKVYEWARLNESHKRVIDFSDHTIDTKTCPLGND